MEVIALYIEPLVCFVPFVSVITNNNFYCTSLYVIYFPAVSLALTIRTIYKNVYVTLKPC